MKKNVLITGAAGFIGFHLSQYLQKRGDTVIGYDNFNDYYTPQLKRDRAALLKQNKIDVIEGDICNFSQLKKTVSAHNITHIAHLAAQAGVRYSLIDPHAYIKANLEGFTNILEICRHTPSIKLTYASSSSVYGLNSKSPFSIEDRTDTQASLYGVTKKTNELMAHSYHHLYGIKVTGLRFFTVYGPWGRPDMAYFSFTKSILEGNAIDVFNQGHLKRDFTYIDDIVNGIAAAIDLGADNELFNLGNNNPVELGHFISVIEDSLNKKAKKNFLPMQKGDVLETYADIKHSKLKLGFSPKVSLENGIPQFVRWYKEYFKI